MGSILVSAHLWRLPCEFLISTMGEYRTRPRKVFQYGDHHLLNPNPENTFRGYIIWWTADAFQGSELPDPRRCVVVHPGAIQLSHVLGCTMRRSRCFSWLCGVIMLHDCMMAAGHVL